MFLCTMYMFLSFYLALINSAFSVSFIFLVYTYILIKGEFCPSEDPVTRATLALHRHIPFWNWDDPRSERKIRSVF